MATGQKDFTRSEKPTWSLFFLVKLLKSESLIGEIGCFQRKGSPTFRNSEVKVQCHLTPYSLAVALLFTTFLIALLEQHLRSNNS
jgi:hypothetical protein